MPSNVTPLVALYFGLVYVTTYAGAATTRTTMEYSNACVIVTELAQKRAECASRNLTSIPSNLGNDIKVLLIDNNSLTYIAKRSLIGLAVLQEILATGNHVHGIHKKAFKHVANLRVLVLAKNLLHSLPWKSFKYLSRLWKLDLSKNRISTINGTQLQQLISLRALNLSGNRIASISGDLTTRFLSHVRHLDLSGNRLQSIRLDGVAGLRTLRLYDNRWRCDCRLRRLHAELTSTLTSTVWRYVNRRPECWSPVRLRGELWSSLTSDRLACAPRTSPTSSTANTTTPGGVIEVTWRRNLTLHCYVFGDPLPLVQWYADVERVVKDSTHNRWLIEGVDFAFDPPRPAPSRVSRYRCTATNIAGEDSVAYAVSLEEPIMLRIGFLVVVAVAVLMTICLVAAVAAISWRKCGACKKQATYDDGELKCNDADMNGDYPTMTSVNSDKLASPDNSDKLGSLDNSQLNISTENTFTTRIITCTEI